MARKFDGIDDKISFGNIANLQNQPALTLSAWVYPTALVNDAVIVGHDDVSNNRWIMQLGEAGLSGTDDALIPMSDGTGNNYGYTTSNILAINTWGHWVARYDGSAADNSTRLQFYFNGIAKTLTYNGTIPTTVATTATVVTAGAGKGGATPFTGGIAMVGLWNLALSTNEISALALGAPPWMFRRSNLQLYAPLYGVASPEPDLSGNVNNGTVTGAVLADHAPVGRYVKQRELYSIIDFSQYGRPSSDISNIGSWEDSTYGDNDNILWDELDEVVPDDNVTAIKSKNNPASTDTFEVKFAAVTDPVDSQRHYVRFRARIEKGFRTITHKAQLYQGAVLIAESTAFTLTTSYQTFYYLLTGAEADSITDYSNLRIRVVPVTS